MRLRRLFALPLVLAFATPAGASTLPEVGLGKGELAATAGFLDASMDLGLTDRLQVGVGTYLTLLDTSRYVRTTFRLVGDSRRALGLHLAAGASDPLFLKGSAPNSFVVTGLAFTQPLGEAFVLRGSLGILFNTLHGPRVTVSPQGFLENPSEGSWGLGRNNDNYNGVLDYLVPNLELAWRLGDSNELTFGGNALIGWRARFKGI